MGDLGLEEYSFSLMDEASLLHRCGEEGSGRHKEYQGA